MTRYAGCLTGGGTVLMVVVVVAFVVYQPQLFYDPWSKQPTSSYVPPEFWEQRCVAAVSIIDSELVDPCPLTTAIDSGALDRPTFVSGLYRPLLGGERFFACWYTKGREFGNVLIANSSLSLLPRDRWECASAAFASPKDYLFAGYGAAKLYEHHLSSGIIARQRFAPREPQTCR